MKTFNLYINDSVFKVFKRFVWKLDENYCLRLGGLQIILDHDQKIRTNPVYFPLWSWVEKPGARELTFFIKNKTLMFSFTKFGIAVYRGYTGEDDDTSNMSS